MAKRVYAGIGPAGKMVTCILAEQKKMSRTSVPPQHCMRETDFLSQRASITSVLRIFLEPQAITI
jgi:hypothetical protein